MGPRERHCCPMYARPASPPTPNPFPSTPARPLKGLRVPPPAQWYKKREMHRTQFSPLPSLTPGTPTYPSSLLPLPCPLIPLRPFFPHSSFFPVFPLDGDCPHLKKGGGPMSSLIRRQCVPFKGMLYHFFLQNLIIDLYPKMRFAYREFWENFTVP